MVRPTVPSAQQLIFVIMPFAVDTGATVCGPDSYMLVMVLTTVTMYCGSLTEVKLRGGIW